MSDHPSHPAAAPAAAEPGRLPRLLALTAVGAGVLVLAAAAFVLSYPGIHALALHAGVSASLARGYPVIFDAMLAIALAAVLSLRGAGVPSRCYAWLSLIVLLAAVAGASALHSARVAIPHRPAAATAAILPWALLLIGFGLLLAMLRHARITRARARAAAAKAAAQAAAAQAQAAQVQAAQFQAAQAQAAQAAAADLAAGQRWQASLPIAALPPGAPQPSPAQPSTAPAGTAPAGTASSDTASSDTAPSDTAESGSPQGRHAAVAMPGASADPPPSPADAPAIASAGPEAGSGIPAAAAGTAVDAPGSTNAAPGTADAAPPAPARPLGAAPPTPSGPAATPATTFDAAPGLPADRGPNPGLSRPAGAGAPSAGSGSDLPKRVPTVAADSDGRPTGSALPRRKALAANGTGSPESATRPDSGDGAAADDDNTASPPPAFHRMWSSPTPPGDAD